MTEIDAFSDLVGALYDSALDSSLWPATLERAAYYVGGAGASLYSKNDLGSTASSRFHWGLQHSFMRNYIEYSKFDPVTESQFLFDVGDVYSVTDCLPYEEFMRTRVYKEWLKPHGWVDQIAATLDKSTTSVAVFGIFRNEAQGLVDNAMRKRMRLILPHVRRAVLIGNVIDLRSGQIDNLTDTLSGLASGVFLVDSDSRLLFENKAGASMLDKASPVRREKSKFRVADPQANRTLREVFASAKIGDLAVGTAGIAVPISLVDDERWIAHILPLTSGARLKALAPGSAVAAVFVRKASIEATSSLKTIAELYSLTRTEARVLGAVARVMSIPALADVLGISEATVKTHLQHIFAKTGKHRQAELVKLVAGHTDPLVS